MSVVKFTLELAGDVSLFTPSVRADMKSAIAARASVDPSAVEVALSPGSVIADVSIQTPTATATSVQSTMASATSSPSSATAMLASVNGISIAVLTVVTPPTIANVAPPPPPLLIGALAVAAETSGSIDIIIGVVVGVIITVVLSLVFMCRRRRLNDNKAPKSGQAMKVDEKATKRAEAQKAEAERDENRANPISSKRSQSSRSKPPRSPPPPPPLPEGSGTEMSSVVGGSMHVVNLVSWKELVLKERLGAGSFGEVREAMYNSTPCAIKSLREATRPAALQELLNEFELTMRLYHPNVLLTMGIAHDDGKTGILMELMPASLLDVLHHHRQREQLATWEASLVLIALDVAKGMAHLQAMDVVHRDLKPGNVLLTEHWVAKVADFGTALTKYAGQAEGATGTPPYMAPEFIALTSGAKAKPTDVWSFGCMLAHMGTRSIPYSHVPLPSKDTMHALLAIIVKGQATPLDQLRNVAGCPPGILELATRCLQTDPVQRPAFPSIVDELLRLKSSVRALRPSTQLRRADVIRQSGAAAAETFISAACCAPTDTSATSIAPTYTLATYSAPFAPPYSSATLPEGHATLIEGFISSARAALFTVQADDSRVDA